MRGSCVLAVGFYVATMSGCGGSSPLSTAAPLAPLSVVPQNQSVPTGGTLQLRATGAGSGQVTWSIDGVPDTDDTAGTVTPEGTYTAPAVVPYPALIVLRATSTSTGAPQATSAITITSPGEDWPKYRRDFFNSGVSGETSINSTNVSQLQLKWKFQASDGIDGSPVVATVNGSRMVYVGSDDGHFYAVNADTGAQVWNYLIDQIGPCAVYQLGCLLQSSATVANGVVYFGAGSGYVYALDALTGSLKWKVQICDPNAGCDIYTSAVVYNGTVYVGVASQYDAPCVEGQVVALNATTGVPVWSFNTIDQSTCPTGNCVGAAVWSSPAVDVRFGTLYVGTGNPAGTCNPPGTNAIRYTDGILGLDLATGLFKSFAQVVMMDTTDLDVGAAPILHQTQAASDCTGSAQTSYWVSVADKNGWIYTAPRGAAGLLGNPTSVHPGSELIAAPLALPALKSTPCGRANQQQTLELDNNGFQVGSDGRFVSLNQGTDGALVVQGRYGLPTCPNGDLCLDLSSPAAINDVLLLGGGDNALHAATTQGKMIWQFNIQGPVISSPAISHGEVYFGGEDGYLYCLSLSGQ